MTPPVEFDCPADCPTKRLPAVDALNTREEPRLNCVVAFRIFAPSVPATFKAPGTCTVSALLPSTTVLLVLTTALAPIAVA